MSMPASSGKAQSNSSSAVPSAALTACGTSSRLRWTFVSGPSIWPDAIRNRMAYPIWPAAPVTATLATLSATGVHLLLQVLVDRTQELLGGQEALVAPHQQRQVLGHLSALHGLHAHALERLGERADVGRVVHAAAVLQRARPGEDRRDRVRRRRLALLVLAEVAGDGAVRGLGLDGLAVGRHQDGGHEPQRAEALGHRVRLHVAVVVL